MFGIDNLASFLLAATLVIIVPGPATLYIAGKAQQSPQAASMATLGIVAGDIVLIGLSGLGFTALMTQWPALLMAMKIGGALYVIYLGLGLLRPRPVVADPNSARTAVAVVSGGFFKGLLITLTNPKPILFFSAFFPMFISPSARSWMQSFYLLGALFEVVNLAYFGTLIVAVARLRRVALFAKFPAGRLQAVVGGGLTACGVAILVSAVI